VTEWGKEEGVDYDSVDEEDDPVDEEDEQENARQRWERKDAREEVESNSRLGKREEEYVNQRQLHGV
jgi:hypothetical protein